MPRLLRSLAMTSKKRMSLRGAKRRGNLRELTDGKFQVNDTSLRLPRPLWGLAMTDVVDGLLPGFVLPCHCEEAKPTWQSVCLQAVIFRTRTCDCAAG